MSAAADSAGAAPLRAATLWWLAGWCMVAFILYGTLSPAKYVPDLHVNDKLEHASAFFGLTFWFGGLVRRNRYVWTVLAMEVLGAGIEVAQGTMGLGRDMDFWDWVADSAGVGVALAALLIITRWTDSWLRVIERGLLGLRHG